MNMLLYLLMVICAIGMIVGVKKDKQGYPWGRPLSIACIIVILLLAINPIMPDRSPQRMAERQQQERFQEIAGEKIGEQLVAAHADGQAFVIALEGHTENMEKGLENAVGNQISLEFRRLNMERLQDMLMDIEGVDRSDPDAMQRFAEIMAMPENISMLLRAQLMDQLIRDAGTEPDAVVSLIGLPADYMDMRLWRQRNHPPMFVVSEMPMMDGRGLGESIARGRLSAVVMRKPEHGMLPGSGMPEETMPRDRNEAFDLRDILVTADNLQEMAGRYPEVFRGGAF